MKRIGEFKKLWIGVALSCALSLPAQASLIVNGGFESGFAGWTRVDQIGSEGTFFLQTGTESPVNLFPVPPPPEGLTAAMTDAEGPGSHVLYQDFVVPDVFPGAIISFALFINNSAPDFFIAPHLDFATPALNQQARVDLMRVTVDPFSVAPEDIVLNLFQTAAGGPLVSGYNTLSFNVTSVFEANRGQTLRLRFAEVDNVAPFNMGVDSVDVNVVPEPSYLFASLGALIGIAILRRRRK